MVSVCCNLVLVIDFDDFSREFLLLVCLYFYWQNNFNCDLENYFYMEAFACLIVMLNQMLNINYFLFYR